MKKTLLNINIVLLVLLGTISCQQDDNNQFVPTARDVQTQADLDDQKIRAFLTNYTFNDKEFQLDGGVDNVKENNFTHENIKFIRIRDDNGNNIPLSEENLDISSGDAIIENKEFLEIIPNITFGNVEHTIYVLKIREGEGKPVTIADPSLLQYRGELLGNGSESFDANQVALTATFETIDFPQWSNAVSSLPGIRQGLSLFKTAKPVENEEIEKIEDPFRKVLKQCQVFTDNNGQQEIVDNSYGIGVVFVPSGLGLFDSTLTIVDGGNIEAYQNIIFSFTLFNTEYTDQDNDGIPSLLEMINENGSINPEIDTDGDGIPNFDDSDDDGDERSTLLEVVVEDQFPEIDSNCDGILTNDDDVRFLDQNENGVPDHLDTAVRVGI